MKKSKRILALTGALLLICLYGSTFIFAFVDRSASADLLMTSIAATILLPVLLYAYILVYRLLHKNESDDTDSDR